jgi:hypothetical protein
MSLNKEDIQDVKTVLLEQLHSIQRLKPFVKRNIPKDYQFIYEEILECNNVIMEIIDGPRGGIEVMVRRNK